VPGLPYRIDGPLALARSRLDRAAERRTDLAWWTTVRAGHDTRALVVAGGRVLTEPAAGGAARLLLQPGSAVAGEERYFLGVDDEGTPFVAVRATDAAAVRAVRDDPRARDLRSVGAGLDDRDAGVLVHAVALAEWHSTHSRCARCGEATEVAMAGHVRRCLACRAEHHPRTDPAIIVLVVDDDDRALLGRQLSWPEHRFSTLAGFVEPGESLEQAVIREVGEETGIRLGARPGDLVYAGSQPWPFPASLMLGFFARAVTTTIRVDGDEISEARWFGRADVVAGVRAGTLLFPPSVSIARRLVEAWFGEPLPGSGTWR
jgi:NAD+ diphosphatase